MECENRSHSRARGRMMDFSSLPKYRGLPDSGPAAGDRDGATRWSEQGATVAFFAVLVLLLLLLVLGLLLLGPILFFLPQLA
jgi:hypothetical protein